MTAAAAAPVRSAAAWDAAPTNFVRRGPVWGSRYPHHDATSAWDALALLRGANVPEPLIARMMGQNAAAQFGIELADQTAA